MELIFAGRFSSNYRFPLTPYSFKFYYYMEMISVLIYCAGIRNTYAAVM